VLFFILFRTLIFNLALPPLSSAISSLFKLALKLTARQFAIALAITLQPCPIFYNFGSDLGFFALAKQQLEGQI
jgi:hypothetical protein